MLHLKIKEMREVRNFSKEYLSIQLDISIQAYNKIEDGKSNMKLSRLYKICNVLKIKPTYFLEK